MNPSAKLVRHPQCKRKMKDITRRLKKLGCRKAASYGTLPISMLRDSRWTEMFNEKGYRHGEFIYPEGEPTSFFIALPDGKIASATNIMCPTALETICEILGINPEKVLGVEPYGLVITYSKDGCEDEDCAICIWTPEELEKKLRTCESLSKRD